MTKYKSALGYNERYNQKYVFYYHVHKLLKWVVSYSPLSSPWLSPDNCLWGSSSYPEGAISTSGPSRWLITSSHWDPCPWGRNQTFLSVCNLRPEKCSYWIHRGQELLNYHWTSREESCLARGSPNKTTSTIPTAGTVAMLWSDCHHHPDQRGVRLFWLKSVFWYCYI